MAKKKRKDLKAPSKEKSNFLGASGRNMTYKDLKRKAIILGMPFPDACSAGVFDLLHYIQSSEERPDKSLIDKYDDDLKNELISEININDTKYLKEIVIEQLSKAMK